MPTAPAQPAKEQGHVHGHPAPRGRGRIVWVLVGVACLAGLFALRAAADSRSVTLDSRLQDFLTLSISVIVESLPFVILGILLSILVQVWLPQGLLMRWLPLNGVLRRLVISCFGIFLPVCECGNVPLARGLVVGGFTVAESLTFLLAAPIINPITIITTHQAFGFDNGILAARIIGGLAIANIIGWLFSTVARQDSLLTEGFIAECRRAEVHAHEPSKWRESASQFARESSAILPALFIGAAVAGAIQVIVPRSVLVSLGSDPLYSILAMLILAFVIAVCSNVDAFFILPFASTFTSGSIVSFLVFGPIIDVKMLAMLRTTFTTKVLLQLTVLVALMSALLGAVVNVLA